MTKKILCFTVLWLFCGSCGGLVIKENIFGNYYLIAADANEDLTLSYHDSSDGAIYGGIIEPTVFAIGFNENYIIAKQHPRTFPNPPDKNITNFYILPIKKGFNWRTKNGLLGPLTSNQFSQKRKELNISDSLNFTIELKDLK
jgi:hypothetical protein